MRSWKRIDTVATAATGLNSQVGCHAHAQPWAWHPSFLHDRAARPRAGQQRISSTRRRIVSAATAIATTTAAVLLFVPAAPAQNPPPDYRRPDQRPQHDDARLRTLGIAAIQSKRLKLYT